jgi:hypothetical protein
MKRQALLLACVRSYKVLAPIEHQWPGRHTVQGQALLSLLLKIVAEYESTSEERTQDKYAMYSMKYSDVV